MKDPRDPLSSTLHTWHHEPTSAPEFNDHVWARLRAADTRPARASTTFLRFPAALPLGASLALLFAVAAGTGGAVALNRTVTTERMAAAYVRTIDPVQMTAVAHPH